MSTPDALLRPGSLALTFVSYEATDDSTVTVRRRRDRTLRRWATYAVVAALLVAIVPVLVVVARPEPGYLTDWLLIVAGILVLLLLGGALLGGWLYQRSARGKAWFDTPVLAMSNRGLTLPTSPRTAPAVTAGDTRPDAAAPEDDEDRDENSDVDRADADEQTRDGVPTGTDDTPADPALVPWRDVLSLRVVGKVRPVLVVDLVEAPERSGWYPHLYGSRHVLDARDLDPSLTEIDDTVSALTRGRLRVRR